jgi:hypothetical protein
MRFELALEALAHAREGQPGLLGRPQLHLPQVATQAVPGGVVCPLHRRAPT